MGGGKSLIQLAQKLSDLIAFGDKYQLWYSRAVRIVELLGADRLDEFCSYYRVDPKRKIFNFSTYVIQDYLNGIAANLDAYKKPRWDIHQIVRIRIVNQLQILNSLKSRIGTVLTDVKGHLLSEIEDEELRVARKLVQVNVRAAGAIAGVVLEGHLQRVAANHDIIVKKRDPTISDLNDPVKAPGVYDIPTWRKIQHLADIRNLCDHKKGREPTEAEVEELITGVNSIGEDGFLN